MSRRIYRDHKEKKHVRDDAAKINSGILNNNVANDIRQNNNLKYSFRDDNFNNGVEWFNSGISLDDAPLELRNNISFVNGFNYAYRIKLVNDTLYNTGIEYFEKGIPLEDIPENYRDNEFFMNGYNSSNIRTK